MEERTAIAISFEIYVAFHTIELCAQKAGSALLGLHPGPVLPRRVMANVPRVAALQIGNPVTFFVAMKSDNGAFHSPGSVRHK